MSFLGSMTSSKAEELKAGMSFDEKMAKAIVHIHRLKELDDETLREQIATNVKRTINPELCLFVANGCERVPHRLKAKAPVRTASTLGLRTEVEVVIREFLERCISDSGGEASKKFVRGAATRARTLVYYVVSRSTLAHLATPPKG